MSVPCDRCGQPATTAHFVPWVNDAERVEFACPDCDPDGYWFEVDNHTGLPTDRDALHHIAEKRDGAYAVALLCARVAELRAARWGGARRFEVGGVSPPEAQAADR
jgi:hypothetical protein